MVIAATALARDYFGWGSGGGTPAATVTTSAGPARSPLTNPEPGTPPANGGSSPVRLDTLAVEAGAANLGKLPRQLAGQPEYDRPIVIGCPTNSGADKQRDVTFRVQRRYLDLTSTVRPFFSSPDDRDGVVFVSAQVAIRQKDGTVTRVTRGQQFEARMDSPQDLVADIEGADELTLRVQCQYPGGSVILTAATVSAG
ncbi:hypothetical protein [Micromonospora sp. WMMD710]|uniref:hypothetical protein n=1 Tax=Micromonospora sp. WMMD710 TaxID=3016085 RepID=UPI00241643CB|nr:hypothetical protein [Micromonospora sp. WMMD710]MDG4758727.1 hypothetical protein [Micromonospora sp. WMMD710]